MYICIVIISLLLNYSLAAHNILVGSLALTLISTTNPPTLSFQPITTVNDPKQLWNFNGAFIYSAAPGFTKYVLASGSGSFTEGAKIMLWTQLATAKSQQWVVEDGVIRSNSTNGYYLAVRGTDIIGTYLSSQKFDIMINTWECYSHGTPRITPYHIHKRNDTFFPGPQMPGTFTLSVSGQPSNINYLLIQVDQQQCSNNIPGSYCNKRAILKTQGHIVEVRFPQVFIDGDLYNGSASGTITVGNGVSVTFKDPLRAVVNHPQGYMEVTQYSANITNVAIVQISGELPHGGLCTKFPTATSAGQFFLQSKPRNRTEDLFPYASDQQWQAANPKTYATQGGYFTNFDSSLLVEAVTSCSPLFPSSPLALQCEKQASSASFYQACFHDFLSTTLQPVVSVLIDGYARVCSKNNPTAVLPTSGRLSTANVAAVAWSSTRTCFRITSRDVNGRVVTTGHDLFTISSSESEEFSQKHLGGGVYEVCYTPGEKNFLVSISLKGSAISGSPFAVKVRSNYSSPANSRVEGPGLISPVKPFATQFFTLTTYTVDNVRRTTGGENVTATVTGNAAVNVVDNSNGIYTITYNQFTANAYFRILVYINGRQLDLPMGETRVFAGPRE